MRGLLRWGLPAAGLLTLAGYFGPWVGHPAAGLVITGLDLGEYVKFLPNVRSGATPVWREGFYAPLVAVSLAWSLHAYRVELRYPWWARAALLAAAIAAALNLLPPAWTPPRLLTPEFRLQTGVMAACLAAVALSPLLALLPRRLAALPPVAVALASLWFPTRGFLAVLPEIAGLYNRPLRPAWGMYVLIAGLIALLAWLLLFAATNSLETQSAARRAQRGNRENRSNRSGRVMRF